MSPGRLMLSCLLASWSLGGLAFGADEADLIKVNVGEDQLDVQLHGSAAPLLFDFDGDGARDLLVGEGFGGRLRIYFNRGTSAQPAFDGYRLFMDGRPAGCVPTNHGFCPAMADIDRDGLLDLLTPAWYGHVRWYRQIEPGKYEEWRPIVNAEGNTIQVEWCFGVTSCDWDNDGWIDLIVGSGDRQPHSNVALLRNTGRTGEDKQFIFENPTAVTANGKPIFIGTGAPAPVAADWDGDGQFDLLVGTGDGSVVWYRNIGSQGEPKFEGAVELLGAPAEKDERGKNAVISVVDWDGDGQLDLLLGDHGERFEAKLTDEEKQAKQDAAERELEAFSRWAGVYRTYRRLAKLAGTESGQLVVRAARKQLLQMRDEQMRHHVAGRTFQEGRQWHGRVWLLLRR